MDNALPSLLKPQQWANLEKDCYHVAGLLYQARSMRRDDVAALSAAFTIMRDLLQRRPPEFGGPAEIQSGVARVQEPAVAVLGAR